MKQIKSYFVDVPEWVWSSMINPLKEKTILRTPLQKLLENDNGTRQYLVLNLFHPKQQLIWSRNVVNVTLIKIGIRSNSFRISVNWQVWITLSQWVNCDKCSQYLDLGQIRIVKPWRENHHKAGCESLHDILLVQLGSNKLCKKRRMTSKTSMM